ncbi:MAG: hypothetical protein COA57_16065 [Flavobacteriales bacterium]|nr:lipopolysaccharide biosynthesis protein [Bacteroidales bacterium AH-315-I05]PCJ78500.1 MAG: hypothetical protein COA57_16065 [Flavobacteriales bacterium]
MRSKFLPQSEFFKNVATLITGTAISQFIPFLILPVLQRWFYSPEDFGLLAVYISLTTVFTNVSTFKYEYAIVLQKRLKNAANLAFLSFYFVLGVSLISLIISVVFKKQLTGYFEIGSSNNFLLLVPVTVLCVGIYEIFNYWNNREKRFSTMAFSKVVQTGTAETTKLLSGLKGLISGGLIVGRVMGQFFSLAYMFFHFLKRDVKILRLHSVKKMRQLAVANKEFPLFTAPSTFLTALIYFTYINLFLKYYGAEAVGMIGVSMSYVAAGMGIISTSISQVFYREIAEITDKKRLQYFYLRFAIRLFALSMVLVMSAYLIPDRWVVYVLGEKWSSLMEVLRIIILWLSIYFVSTSLGFIYIKVGRQRAMLVIRGVHLVLLTFGIWLAHHSFGDFYTTLWTFTWIQSAFYIFAILIAVYFIRQWKAPEPTSGSDRG